MYDAGDGISSQSWFIPANTNIEWSSTVTEGACTQRLNNQKGALCLGRGCRIINPPSLPNGHVTKAVPCCLEALNYQATSHTRSIEWRSNPL